LQYCLTILGQLIVAYNIAASPKHVWARTAVTLGNRFLSATGSRTLTFDYRRYGLVTLLTTGLLVL